VTATLARPRPVLYALVGPPGAGKTSLRPWFPDAVVVSLDEIRAALSCCDSNQDPDLRERIVPLAHHRAATWLQLGTRTVLWDATNAHDMHRQALVDLAHRHDARAVAVLVLPALDVVLARNATRDPAPCWTCGYPRRVPEMVVRRMHAAITKDLPNLGGEGWDAVRVGTLADCPGAAR
jgi:predicted kinase